MIFTAALLLAQAGQPVRLSSLDLTKIDQGWGSPGKDKSVDGNPLSIGGVKYPYGVGTHAVSEFRIKVNGNALRFTAKVGVDDEVKDKGRVDFQVFGDGKRLWGSGEIEGGEKARDCSVDLKGVKELLLHVEDGEDGIDYDHADWADAVIVMKSGSAGPVSLATGVASEPPMKIAMGDPKGVMIHGPRVVGTTPGRPFLFRIPATGVARSSSKLGTPAFSVVKGRLPAGLMLDSGTGIITGSVKTAGTYKVTIQAKGRSGSDRREYTIVAGQHKLALTPPMGWNSWNVWGTSVDANKVKAAADQFVKTGLADYGYGYVNIDDAWEGSRDSDGFVQTNQKFGDMKSLSDYLHGKGLKLGIYSSPGPKTCAGYEGSYQHELKDAQQWAKWGIDYVKYDWCSYGQIAKDNSKPELQKPYLVMRDALDQVNRDIVFSLCQYGMGDVFLWGKTVTGGNLWRTTGDITDTWKSMETIGFSHNFRSTFTSPGGWNDPDMLVVGQLGWGPRIRPTRLTPNEQITHITLWSLLAAPLLIGCDLTKLDPFTKSLLCNHDVLEVDQDPLGKGATRRIVDGKLEVWARPLWDGTMAVGLFNRGTSKAVVKADLTRLGYRSSQPVRDLWQMKNVPGKTMMLQREVPAHGAMLFKVGTPVR